MEYWHSFRVKAPLEEVSAFHRRSASMGAITPPPIIVQVHHAPDDLVDGDEMSFTLWMGPLPVRWLARIEEVGETGFLDRQVKGPFSRWDHRHIFVPIGSEETIVIDGLNVELHRTNLFWKVVGLAMWLGLPALFAFRGWRTRTILGRQKSNGAQQATRQSEQHSAQNQRDRV